MELKRNAPVQLTEASTPTGMLPIYFRQYYLELSLMAILNENF